MESRYRLMTKEGVRNIEGYNSKHRLPMPFIVVVVDEMSDLMLVAGKEIIFKNCHRWRVQLDSYNWQRKDLALM